jgi:hypothetical protein
MAPGINKNLTSYTAEGTWVDCDKIRFRNSRAEKIGGWVRETVTQAADPSNILFTGVARDMLAWSSLDSKKFIAVASNKKVELLTDNRIYDITPIRDTITGTDILSTVDTESEVNIYEVNHNTVVGDYVFVNSQASAIGGITLTGSYIVTEVVDADNFKVDAGTAANATTANAGGAVNISLLLENGAESNGSLTGYSGGTWNTEGASGQGYNRPRSATGGLNLRQWSLDNWGEDLIACMRNGRIYQWDRTNDVGVRLQELTNAPEENLFVLVSQPSRHLVAFGSEVFSTGTFDPLIIRWAERETLTGWTITPTNTAGEYRLPKGDFIVGAVQTRSEIVVFTNTDVYSMRFVGGDEIFRFEPLGTNISAISQHSFIDVNGVVFWMGIDSFYMYDGVVRILPSTISKYIFDQDGEGRINFTQKEKIHAGINKEFNEVWWFYPKSGQNENGSYVKYNTVENVWDFGTLDRTAWVDRSVFERPYAMDPNGRLYVHEVGKDADSQPMTAFIKSAFFDIEDGENIMFVDRIVPDIRLAPNRDIEISVTTKKYPHPTASTIVKGPYYFSDTDNKISLRARGRQMALEFRVVSNGSDFEIGKIRLGFQTDGER